MRRRAAPAGVGSWGIPAAGPPPCGSIAFLSRERRAAPKSLKQPSGQVAIAAASPTAMPGAMCSSGSARLTASSIGGSSRTIPRPMDGPSTRRHRGGARYAQRSATACAAGLSASRAIRSSSFQDRTPDMVVSVKVRQKSFLQVAWGDAAQVCAAATMDQTDIRGLVTTVHRSVVEAASL